MEPNVDDVFAKIVEDMPSAYVEDGNVLVVPTPDDRHIVAVDWQEDFRRYRMFSELHSRAVTNWTGDVDIDSKTLEDGITELLGDYK